MRKLKLGCSISNLYMGILMYADDVLLLSSSCIELQNMLNICSDIGSDLGIQFNGNKSKCLFIGKNKFNSLNCRLSINNVDLVWCDKLKYLGTYIKSDKSFKIDFSDMKGKYFASLNSILSRTKFCSDLVKLELIEKHCFPLLLYCIEVFNLDSCELCEINVCANAIYRKIFGYNKWESVKQCIYYLGRLDIFHIYKLRKILISKVFKIQLAQYYVIFFTF